MSDLVPAFHDAAGRADGEQGVADHEDPADQQWRSRIRARTGGSPDGLPSPAAHFPI
jgi:hypothetical protein